MDYTVYAGGLSGIPLQIGRDIAIDNYNNYLFFRGGEYDYYYISGDITQVGLDYNYNNCTVININYSHTDDMRMYYSVHTYDNISGTVYNGASVLCYTDISNTMPRLIDRGDIIVQTSIFFAITTAFCVYIFNSIFANVSRR